MLGVLDDKDAASMLARAAAAVRARLVHRAAEQRAPCRRRRCSRSRASSASSAVDCEPEPGRALAAARAWAPARHGGGGARDRLDLPGRRAAGERDGAETAESAAPARGRRVNDEGPSVLTMIGAVALIVALVILVFFAAGYGFGRLFL